MCRFQRRAPGKNDISVVYGVIRTPTPVSSFIIRVPVINDLLVIAQNLPLCTGFQLIDGEAVAFFIDIIKVVTGLDGFVVVNFDERREIYIAIFIVDAAAVVFMIIKSPTSKERLPL